MSIISKSDFSRLSGIHDANCISIFIPTHRSGHEVIEQKDPIVLKNQIKDVKNKLEDRGLNVNEVATYIEPIKKLLEDREFWRHQSDGLAIFLADGIFETYSLPLNFDKFNYVSNEFYLKPLMPMFGGDGRFFILALELEDVNFYEGTRYSITDVYIDDLTPKRLEERVGFDYKEAFLQFRSQQEGGGRAIFHGHGDGEADRKDEIRKYFRAINDGLMKMLYDETPPMIVASLDHYFPIYKEVNTYNHMVGDEFVRGNPSDLDILDLHANAWKVVGPLFDMERRDRIAAFNEKQTTNMTSSDIRKIIPAAVDGKIDTLFLQNHADAWGIYDPSDRKVEIRGEHITSSVSLLNLAATEVFEKGGHVYLLEEDDMPGVDSIASALYRY